MGTTFKEYLLNQTQRVRHTTGETAADHVLKLFGDHDLASFDQIYQQFKDNSPVRGQRFLFNQHQDAITWVLMLLFQALGAHVEATAFGTKCTHFASSALEYANIPFFQDAFPPEHPSHLDKTYFHRIFDCGAATLRLKLLPAYGTIELTYTKPDQYTGKLGIYETLNRRFIKLCETLLGTGPAVVDTVLALWFKKFQERNDSLAPLESETAFKVRFKNRYYLIIGGAGNVAAGIVRALIKKGIRASHIMLIDMPTKRGTGLVTKLDDTKNVKFLNVGLEDKQALDAAVLAHIQATEATEKNPNNSELSASNFWGYVVIGAATGQSNLLTTHGFKPDTYPKTLFFHAGHTNELGSNFPGYCSQVLGDPNGPVNFHPIRFDTMGYATDPRLVRPCSLAMAWWGLHNLRELTQGCLHDIDPTIDATVFRHMLAHYADSDLGLDILIPLAREHFPNANALFGTSPAISTVSQNSTESGNASLALSRSAASTPTSSSPSSRSSSCSPSHPPGIPPHTGEELQFSLGLGSRNTLPPSTHDSQSPEQSRTPSSRSIPTDPRASHLPVHPGRTTPTLGPPPLFLPSSTSPGLGRPRSGSLSRQ